MFLHMFALSILKNFPSKQKRLESIPSYIFEKETKLTLDVTFFSPRWFTKSGKIAKLDLDNRLKALLDAIETNFGIDDRRYFTINAHKCLGEKDKTDVIISEFLI